LVLTEIVQVLIVSLAAGLGIAVIAGRFISSFLYDISPVDPLTYGAVTLLLATVGLVAAFLPARKSTRVDPTVALRHE
jgi:putative ABC transport system permease protein